MSEKEKTIQPEDELKEVFKNPRAKRVFAKYGMGCLSCGGFAAEKLRHAARCHGLDVEALIRVILPED